MRSQRTFHQSDAIEFRSGIARLPWRSHVVNRSRARTILIAIAALCVAVTVSGQTAPAIENGRPSGLGSRLGPAPHEATGFKNLDPNFRRASNLLRTRLAVLSLFSLIGSPRHFEALPAATVDTALLWSNSRQTTATWI